MEYPSYIIKRILFLIPSRGTKKIKYLEENLDAAGIKLTAAENAEIRKAVQAVEVHGGRYPAGFEAALFADTPALP